MDVLGSVLRELRFESTEYRLLRLGAPFRVSFAEPGLRGVHVVVQGECEVRVDGGRTFASRPVSSCCFPAAMHTTCVRPMAADNRHSPASLSLSATAPGQEVRGGGSGVETVLLCGAFFVTRHDHPALAAMPRVVHVSEGQGGQHWLAPYVNALESEVRHGGPGSAVVTARLSDALVARALRYEAEVADEPGLLHGLADPYVAPVLAAMHDDPARPWTVASLAAVAGLSRAAFAARFRERVGTTPGEYLLSLRMARASMLLRDERSTLATVAAQIGYGSEAAFSAAFKRYAGIAPGAYRRGFVPHRSSESAQVQ